MRDFRIMVTAALLALAVWAATVNPLQADVAIVRVVFGTSGIVVGLGNGRGTLTFHGKTYPFEVSGASVGPMLTLAVSEFDGRAANLSAPGDLAGNYIAVGAGAAIGGGAGVAWLRNAKGVTLVLRGPKVGAGFSINLARVTIRML